MTRAVTLSYEDAVLVATMLGDWGGPERMDPGQYAAAERLCDALDEAEAQEPSGLFPAALIVGPSGDSRPLSTSEVRR